MTKSVMEVPGSNGHPAKEAVVPLDGQPVDVHVRPQCITAPASPIANSLLGDLQCEAGTGSASAQAVVVIGPVQSVGEGGQEAREPA